jgi:hypothetical protein
MMNLITFVVDQTVFLQERDGANIVLMGSLNKVGIRYVEFFVF